jgi:hypothetical protein
MALPSDAPGHLWQDWSLTAMPNLPSRVSTDAATKGPFLFARYYDPFRFLTVTDGRFTSRTIGGIAPKRRLTEILNLFACLVEKIDS